MQAISSRFIKLSYLIKQPARFFFCTFSLTLPIILLLGSIAEAQKYRKEDQELFSKKYQQRIIQSVAVPADRLKAIQDWQKYMQAFLAMPAKDRPNETDLHEQFFTDVFVKVLGYQKRTASQTEWTLRSEYTTDVDKTRPDGVLGFFNGNREEKQVEVVIELKGINADLDRRQNRKKDKHTPVDQAFSYAHKFDKVQWVIVSNYKELRLYNQESSKYASHFDLTKIADPENESQLKLFLLLLSKESLIARQGISKTNGIFTKREEELKQITEQFYTTYKATRLATAQNILKNNAGISIDSAVTTTQIILDRIIFIAFLEDLNLITAEIIKEAYKAQNVFNPVPIWDNFKGLFNYLDKGKNELEIPAYNGGLFKNLPAIYDLTLDDSLFTEYKKLADYDFSSDLKVDILGQVFEQSITDIEVLKAQLHGKTEVEDTRRHDEGAYYTSNKITNYIVEHTIGAYLEAIRNELGFESLPKITKEQIGIKHKRKRRTAHQGAETKEQQQHIAFWEAYAQQLKNLKIVDPSCGSGAFLVAAFDYLEQEGKRIDDKLDKLQAPNLFINFYRDILKNNLYGVDLSPEAVEITRLSLWLKIANNKEKLVALDQNILHGNAVVDDLENGFNWQQAFPEIMQAGGFDIVIGNPPYVRHELIKPLKPQLKERFSTYTGSADLYVFFYELGYDLLKKNGYLGYISSNKWMRARYGKKLRTFIKDKTSITNLLDLGSGRFKDASVDTNILIFKKAPPQPTQSLRVQDPPFNKKTAKMAQAKLTNEIYQLQSDPLFWSIKQKMESTGTPLKQWDVKINRGVVTGFNKAFVIDTATKERLVNEDPKSTEIIKPMLRGRDIERWYADWQELWLIFTRRGINIEQYPAIKEHLMQYYEQLKPRNQNETTGRKPGDYQWYEIQDTISYYKSFETEKIVYPVIAQQGQFFVDSQKYYRNDKAFHLISENPHYLSAILNSSLIDWYFISHFASLGVAMEFREIFMEKLPVPKISPAQQQPFIAWSQNLHQLAAERLKHFRLFTNLLKAEFKLEQLSPALMQWHKHSFARFLDELKELRGARLAGKQKEDWQERFKRLQQEIQGLNVEIQKGEQQLNGLVNELYGLTKEEVRYLKN